MKILFVGPLVSTFVKNDVTILSREHDVHTIDVNLGKGKKAALNLILLHLRILFSLVGRDALFFWFADYYTLVPSIVARMLGKKVFVVAGGFDITFIPELGIGARTRPWRWFAVRNTFRVAHHIFPVSQDTLNDLDSAVPKHSPATMIYNAVDTKTFHYDRRHGVGHILTVAQSDSLPEFKRKGIDLFMEIAKDMPDCEFHIVGVRGMIAEVCKQSATEISNLTVIPGRVPLDQLLDEFWSAPVYCQLSIEERFGVSVAEAMSCGCIPVVAPVNALMEVVGDAGYIVSRDDREGIINALRNALADSDSKRMASSEHAELFDIDHRAAKLLGVVNSI